MKKVKKVFDVYYGWCNEEIGYWVVSSKEGVIQQLFLTLVEGTDVVFLDMLEESTVPKPSRIGVYTGGVEKAGKIYLSDSCYHEGFCDVLFDAVSRFWLLAKASTDHRVRIKLEFGRAISLSPKIKEKVKEMKRCGKIYFLG